MSLGFLFHGSCLINDHVKRSFGTASLCSATELLFFSSRHGRSQSNLWMSGSPQKHSEAPEKLDRGVGGLGRGVSHKMLSCISCVKGLREGPFLNPAPWEIKELQRLLVHRLQARTQN